MKYVHRAQEILADDLYITQFGWGPGVIHAYNAGEWEGVVPVVGFGVADFNVFHTYLRIKPKGNRKRAVVGVTAVDRSINLISAGNRYRAIGRMIYDRLAFLDENLEVIPWARSEEHTSELQSLMRISYAVFCLKKKIESNKDQQHYN